MFERKVGEKIDPCILIARKLYNSEEDLYHGHGHDNLAYQEDCKNNEQNNVKTSATEQFNYGSYIIAFTSDKEKEIDNFGHITYSNSINKDDDGLKEELKSGGDENQNSKSSEVVVNLKSSNLKTGYKRYIGFLLAIIATMSYSLATLIVKLNNHIHPFTLSFWRFQGILVPAIPLLLYSRFGLKKPVFNTICPATTPDKWKMIAILIIRSIIGCTSTICHITSLQYINMADASVIAFSCPIFVSLVAHLFLGEKCGLTPFVISISTLSGVIIITRPPMLTGGQDYDMNTLIGVGLAFASMVTASFVIILLRYLRSTHFSFMMTIYGFVGSIECLIIAYYYQVLYLPISSQEWIYCGLLVSLTFLAQITLVSALKYEEAGPVSLIQSCDVVFAFIWQFLFLSTIPDFISLTGASIVIFGVIVTTFRKWLLTLPDENETKKRFKVILM